MLKYTPQPAWCYCAVALRREGYTYRQIAEKYGVSCKAVERAITWNAPELKGHKFR